eukprot:5921699-Heterocapsa_arctica.AAC.1
MDKGNSELADHRVMDRCIKYELCGLMWTQTGSSNLHHGKQMRWEYGKWHKNDSYPKVGYNYCSMNHSRLAQDSAKVLIKQQTHGNGGMAQSAKDKVAILRINRRTQHG